MKRDNRSKKIRKAIDDDSQCDLVVLGLCESSEKENITDTESVASPPPPKKKKVVDTGSTQVCPPRYSYISSHAC
jgi:hypothetical protein